MPTCDLSPFIQEPMAEYRAKRPDFLTSHQLIEYLACPPLYRKAMAGLVPKRFSEAFLIGSATHCLALEGRAAFERDYVVGGPINPKTEKPYGSDTKAFAEWAKSTGKTALSDDQYALVCNMTTAVRSHKLARALLKTGIAELFRNRHGLLPRDLARALLKTGIAEGVLRAEYAGVPCQIRVDWFSADEGLVDLKTCEDLDACENDARRFQYVAQMAFYRAVYQAVTGACVPVHLIAVEKREPHRCGVWLIDAESLSAAEARNLSGVRDLVVSRRENVWPTHYEELRTLAA